MRDNSSGSLTGIRVVEAGVLLAGPFCGQLLGDLGAEVIKVEAPGLGDPMRRWGQSNAVGESLWWPIVARNKKSIELDLRNPAGQMAFRKLAAVADVVIENFRPGTLEKWGIGYEQLREINPRLIMVRVSGFGQTGPYAHRAGYASVGEAMGGLRHVVGYPDLPPSRVGISLGDTLAGTFGALGALAALHERGGSGEGQMVDCAIYEAVLACMESLIPEYVIGGHIRERTGAILKNVAPSSVYPARDGDLIIAANQDTVFRRLCAAMNMPGLADDPKFSDHTSRGENQQELDELISEWSSPQSMVELERLLESFGVPAGRIYCAPDMLEDAHFKARNTIVEVKHDRLGQFPMQNIFPKLSRTPSTIRWPGPELGSHNQEVLADLLRLSEAEIAEAQKTSSS